MAIRMLVSQGKLTISFNNNEIQLNGLEVDFEWKRPNLVALKALSKAFTTLRITTLPLDARDARMI